MVHVHVRVFVCVCVCVCSLGGTWMCGESWLAIKLFNPPSQFSRLGILVSSSALCFLMALTIVRFVASVHVHIWHCVYCLSGLPFFPSYFYII